MKTSIILALAVMIVFLFTKVYYSTAHQPSVKSVKEGQPSGTYHSGNLNLEPASEKYRYESLQLYPIIASQVFLLHHQELGPYLSLHEALDQKKIIVTELTTKENRRTDAADLQEEEAGFDVAEVNRLFVENVSSNTIIILGGEVIRGGKQDRMIAEDFMIMPHNGKIDIAVYCVEHGRWSGSDADAVFSIVMDVAPNKVRRAAKQAAPQEEIWAEIQELNEDLDVNAPTQALGSAVSDSKMETSMQPYKDHLGKIEWPQRVVGVIAVMGNEILGLDVFAKHDLFIKYFPSLLSSYCSDAYGHRDSGMMPYEEVQSFFNILIRSEQLFEKRIQENGTQLKHKEFRIHAAVYGDVNKNKDKR